MGAFEGLWRDTWWLWLGFAVSGLFLGIGVSFIFFVIFPISIVTFVYFALVRYDEEGKLKGDDE